MKSLSPRARFVSALCEIRRTEGPKGFEIGALLLEFCGCFELNSVESKVAMVLFINDAHYAERITRLAEELQEACLRIFRKHGLSADELIVVGTSNLAPEVERDVLLVLCNSMGSY